MTAEKVNNMNKRYSTIKIIILPVLFVLLALVFTGAKSSSGSLSLPSVERTITEKGSKFFFIKDDLPLFSVTLSFNYGQLYEDEKTAGLGTLMASCMSIAGSEKYPGNKLHEYVESMGGTVSVNSSWESVTVSITVLHRFSAQAMNVLADLAMNPRFDEDSFETAKSLTLDGIRRLFDEPADIAFEKAREVIFGGKGYGSVATVKGVSAFTVDDVKVLSQKCFTAKNLTAGIVYFGNYNETSNLVISALNGLSAGTALDYDTDADSIKNNIRSKRDIIFLYPKDIPQATIVAGTLAPAVLDKDQMPLALMNYILGGGSFNSRLMDEIRVKRGLAYSVGSVVRLRARTGVFLSYVQVASENAPLALSLLVENINTMAKTNVSESELTWAKSSISNSYIFGFDTPVNVLSKYINRSIYSLPDDYYDTYLEKLNKVEADEISSATTTMLESGLIRLVVGSKSLIPELEKLGRVEVLNAD